LEVLVEQGGVAFDLSLVRGAFARETLAAAFIGVSIVALRGGS